MLTLHVIDLTRLVLIHSINGKNLEKYYVLGTVILSLVLTVPAVALGQFGYVL